MEVGSYKFNSKSAMAVILVKLLFQNLSLIMTQFVLVMKKLKK